ncbi:hypothetical protein HN51_028868 [Arachis hypogaea]|uniref:SnoaL-like domain-containing protein n=1 Tax=Arachis hypogaea TaxID=3818 RepID=A0A445BGS3_ARAHY|nr:uncharacterized protein LOC112711468 [Arachis hypogaea]QHO35429.1 hypothetical protein DS421_9g275390 [Arachis hypogaea]RYR37884.1 hypothetical protein Ahy_A09g042800 [Arachis hypogaea]
MAPLLTLRLFNISSRSSLVSFQSSLSQLVFFASFKVSISPMDHRSDEKTTSDSADPNNNHRFSDRILPHLLRLYGSCATSQDFEIYAPNASFEDPLMRAHGVKQIKSAFYTLPKVFKESKIVEYTVEENMVSPGKGEILIDNKQYYKFLGKHIDMVSLIKLYVDDGKIVRHEDWWDKKPISNRETVKVPLLGRAAEVTRRGSMLLTHLFMGFGKDPTV